MASLAALHDARAALEECLSALESVESELEGEAVAGGEAGEVTTLRKRERERERESEFGEGRRRRFCSPPLSGKKLKQLRSALRSAVAEAAATVVALEDETGEWEERDAEREERGIPPRPPWAPGSRLDFAALAARHPRLAPFLVRKRGKRRRKGDTEEEEEEEESPTNAVPTTTLDFTSHDACAALTSVLLQEGCGIRNWSVPKGSLVPPLGVRDEYLDYVSRLVSSSSVPPAGERRRRPRILDVGCGSNLVFCLLASSGSSFPAPAGEGRRRRRCCWRSVGLDVSPVAIADAREILDCNPHLQPLIELRQGPEEGLVDAERVGILRHGFAKKRRNGGGGPERSKGDDDVLGGGKGNPDEPHTADPDPDLDLADDEWFDATVCNPPFFSSAAERAATASSYANGAWGGTDAEVVFATGGEAAFVSKLISESRERDFEIGRRVGWFTVFLGKKATLRSMVALLRGGEETEGGAAAAAAAGGGGGEEKEKRAEGAGAATAATANNPLRLLETSKEKRRPALRWRALDEHGGRTTRWVLAWSWTQQK